eukprot:SAG31_NODE_832_length_11660_cov_2.612091_4_plen_110_part_00
MNTTTVLDYNKHEVRLVNNNERLLAKERVLGLLAKGPPYATRAGFGKNIAEVKKYPFPDEPEPEPTPEGEAAPAEQEPATPRQPVRYKPLRLGSKFDAIDNGATVSLRL